MAYGAVIWDMQMQHLDEAELMLEATLRALDSPRFTIDEVAQGPERRLLAHIDALIVGGPEVAAKLLVPALADERDIARVGAAALALLYADDPLGHRCLMSVLDDEALAPACRIGLVWAFSRCIRAGTIEWLAAGMDVAPFPGLVGRLETFGRRHVDMGGRLAGLLERQEPELLRAASYLMRCCWEEPAVAVLPRLMYDADVDVCRTAVESGLILAHPVAWQRTLELASANGPLRRDALIWIALFGNSHMHARLLGMLGDTETRADLLWALGFVGRRSVVDAALGFLADEQLGPLAAEVVCAVAGLSPVAEDDAAPCWLGRQDAAEPPEFEDDDLNARLEPGSEDLLPHPNPDAVAKWWYERRSRFDANGRYLLGHPHGSDAVAWALNYGATRRRHVLALELAVRSHGGILLDAFAPCMVQRGQLAQLGRVAADWDLAYAGGAAWD